jgi:hypothetical protein
MLGTSDGWPGAGGENSRVSEITEAMLAGGESALFLRIHPFDPWASLIFHH